MGDVIQFPRKQTAAERSPFSFEADFDARAIRIRETLQRINELMVELRKGNK